MEVKCRKDFSTSNNVLEYNVKEKINKPSGKMRRVLTNYEKINPLLKFRKEKGINKDETVSRSYSNLLELSLPPPYPPLHNPSEAFSFHLN